MWQVGAGIQIPSNSTRLLSRLGLDLYLEKYVTEPEAISFRRWQTGQAIGLTSLIPDFRALFGAPYYVIHRANFHSALHQRALDLGVTVKLASQLFIMILRDQALFSRMVHLFWLIWWLERMVCTSVFWWHRCDGSNFIAGVKSVAPGTLDESGSQSFEPTGFAAYRATVDVQRIKEGPDLS